MVEHRSPKPGVGSSSLSSRAKEVGMLKDTPTFFRYMLQQTMNKPTLKCVNILKVIMKYLLIILGSISLALGVIGIFLPLLPTTPLLLLAATLYVRSSDKLYQWLIHHKYLGSYIRNFREHRAIPLRAKIISVSLLWITLSYCSITVSEIIWIKLSFIALAISISWYILSFKTLK